MIPKDMKAKKEYYAKRRRADYLRLKARREAKKRNL